MADRPRICMVGSSNIDLIVRAPHLPAPGETLHGHSFKIGFGGKGANQAVMAARLGAQVSVVTKLGRDTFGETTLSNYRDQGIDTTYALFDEQAASGVALIEVDDRTGQNSIVLASGANDTLTPEDVRGASAAIMAAQVIICQIEVPLAATLEAFRIAKSAGNSLTILNPAPAAPLPDELLGLTDILVPNEVEAGMLINGQIETDDQAVEAARTLQKLGPRIVVITLGSGGVLVVEGDQPPQFIAAKKVQAVDTTGAGDAFVGSFAYLLGAGQPTVEAARRASAIATRSVLKSGTQTSFPKRDEVLSLLQ